MTGLLEESSNKEVWVHIDTIAYKEKPSADETKNIQNRILEQVESLSIEMFAQACGSGKSFKTGVLPNGSNAQNSLITIQVLALDFDNTDSEKEKLVEGYTTRDEILDDDFIKQYGAFIYDSFSSKKEHQKFRVVFILDHALTDHEEFSELYCKMRERFPYSDPNPSSAANLFYGGRNVEEINYDNLLPIFSILEDASYIEEEKLDSYVLLERKDREFENSPIWKLLKNGRKEIAKKKSEKINKSFDTYSDAEEYFLQTDLRKHLGFPTKNPFKSPFREDKEASTSIFKSNTTGNWLYKDSGFLGGKNFDIITLLQDIILRKKSGNYSFKKYSRREVLDLLLELTSCSVKKTEEQMKISEKIFEIETLLLDEKLEFLRPNIYKVIVKKKYSDLILLILNVFKYSYYEEDANIYHLSWYSSRALSKIFEKKGMKISEDRIKNALKVMSILGILENLSDNDIPTKLLEKLEETKESYKDKNEVKHKRFKVQDRRSNVYKLNTDITADMLEEVCKMLIEHNYSIRNLNKEWVLRYFGKEKADMVFPQNIDVHRGISKRSEDFEKAFSRVFFQIFENRGFVVISKVKWVLRVNFGFSENEFDKHWSRIKKEFCEKYDMNLSKVRENDRFIMGVTKNYAGRNSSIVYANYSKIQEA